VVSLLSDCVARFRLEADREVMVDILIPRLSLYIMRWARKVIMGIFILRLSHPGM
jgi:hypothetical protein